MKFKFKEEFTCDHRKQEAAKIRDKYPERIPVIVEKVAKSQIQEIDKRKFLVPSEITVAQFMWIIRRRIQLHHEKAIFLFVGKVLPQTSASMGQVYEEHKDIDGFLYIAYSGENTFGGNTYDKNTPRVRTHINDKLSEEKFTENVPELGSCP